MIEYLNSVTNTKTKYQKLILILHHVEAPRTFTPCRITGKNQGDQAGAVSDDLIAVDEIVYDLADEEVSSQLQVISCHTTLK